MCASLYYNGNSFTSKKEGDVAKERKKIWIAVVALLFLGYFFIAARPVPKETILTPRWLSSLDSDLPVPVGESSTAPDFEGLIPFSLGSRFGYVNARGHFPVNQVKSGEVCLSESLWAEYGAEPDLIEIKTSSGETALKVENPRAYPLLLDGRIFLVGSEQNALRELDSSGAVLWTYEFAAPLTCIDAAAGLILTGSLDGAVEVLNNKGERIFFFETGGSRYAVILGCAISRDGSRLGIISGIDDQRFLLMERFGTGGDYKVIYHEFLEDGFRRPVHISFIDQDRWLVFERQGGAGVYELGSRKGTKIALDGEIAALDGAGGQGLFFVVTSQSAARKKLVGIRLPGKIFLEAPFQTGSVFLGRRGSRLFIGGGSALASFELEKK
jgi:hypothetical protein